MSFPLVSRKYLIKQEWLVLIYQSQLLSQLFKFGCICDFHSWCQWQKLWGSVCGKVSYWFQILMVTKNHFILTFQVVGILSKTFSKHKKIILHFLPPMSGHPWLFQYTKEITSKCFSLARLR